MKPTAKRRLGKSEREKASLSVHPLAAERRLKRAIAWHQQPGGQTWACQTDSLGRSRTQLQALLRTIQATTLACAGASGMQFPFLATAPGPLRNRVFDAYEQYLSPLRADDFTLELRPSVEKLHHDIVAIVDRSKREKSPYYLQRCGAFEAAKAYLGTGHLNPQLAQALAKLICDLYIKVERGPSVAVILPDPRRNTVL